jgi:prepilin-type processing-associated H-X9-DG protein
MRQSAVTRIEVIVVLTLGFLLAGVLVLALARLRENGQRIECMNNLRRIGDGLQSFQSPTTPYLPPARIAPNYATWAVLIAPHVDAKNKLTNWEIGKTYFAQDAAVREAVLPAYFCPARARTLWLSVAGDIDPATQEHIAGALGDYAGVAGTGDRAHPWDGPDADGAIVLGEVLQKEGDQIVRWRSRTSLPAIQASRGLSVTLLIGEKHVPASGLGRGEAGDASLYDGQNPACSSRIAGPGHGLAASAAEPFNNNFGSAHNGVCQFLFADGSVRPLAVGIDENVLGELARR